VAAEWRKEEKQIGQSMLAEPIQQSSNPGKPIYLMSPVICEQGLAPAAHIHTHLTRLDKQTKPC
jgi:hypothetical protein